MPSHGYVPAAMPFTQGANPVGALLLSVVFAATGNYVNG